MWEGCVRGTGGDAGGVVVVEEDARRERAGWLGPVFRPGPERWRRHLRGSRIQAEKQMWIGSLENILLDLCQIRP